MFLNLNEAEPFMCTNAIAVSCCLICKYLIEMLGARLTVKLVNFADTHCHEQNLFLTLQVSKISSASAFPWERC